MRRAVKGLPISVEVRYRGEVLFQRDSRERRPPASVQKLMLTMALFDAQGAYRPIDTHLAARPFEDGLVEGDLWVLGRGDPSIVNRGRSQRGDFPTRLGLFVKRIRRLGITRVEGSVAAAKNYFLRDWDASGWKDDYQEKHIALPTALTFNGNTKNGHRVTNPERVFARKLTDRLRRSGVKVRRAPKVGTPGKAVDTFASVRSAPLWVLTRAMNKTSLNFYAEVLGKRLGALQFGAPGSIKKGARAIERYAKRRGAGVRAFDSSGLSFANRASPRAVVKLLQHVRGQKGWTALRRGLPTGGEGTLAGRLKGVPLRAKTGSLIGVSTLAGWVWMEKVDDWAEFAIMSRGISPDRADRAEDEIVRITNARAKP